MAESFVDGIKDAWNDREIPMWIGSTLLHLILLFAMSRYMIPADDVPEEASIQTRIAEIPEPEPIEEIPEIELPPEEVPSPQQDEIVEAPTNEAAPDSVEVPNPPEQKPDTLSPVENPPLDAMTSMIEGAGPMAQAAKGAGGILNSRGKGNKMGLLASQGGSKETEDAVHWGLEWLVRHQFPDGSWNLDHTKMAKGATSGQGEVKSIMAATALGTLPFLAAGYTHKEGPYKKTVFGALKWMVENQQGNGLLKGPQDRYDYYTHGLATIAMCEGYALSKDPYLEGAARKAIKFLLDTQNNLGGWRYSVGDGQCDSSVLGWQLMGMKSAVMAGIEVPPAAFDGCKKFLNSVRLGASTGKFGYLNENGKVSIVNERCETAIGNLCFQFMGMPQNDPTMLAACDYMLAHPVSMQARDAYYWYYANQVIHNIQGPKWDQWNRVMKRVLTESQNTTKGDTDHGSWDPVKPSKDAWGKEGGRHMVTCLHILCLEIYYRYLPIYLMNDPEKKGGGAPEGAKPPAPAEEKKPEAEAKEPAGDAAKKEAA